METRLLKPQDLLSLKEGSKYIFVTLNPERIGRYVVHLRKSLFIKVTPQVAEKPFLFVLVQKNIFNPEHFTYIEKTSFGLQDFKAQVIKCSSIRLCFNLCKFKD